MDAWSAAQLVSGTSLLLWALLAAGVSESWQGAVDVLTANSINLMNSIKELLKEASATSKAGPASSKGVHS